jgi:hypothetical protein
MTDAERETPETRLRALIEKLHQDKKFVEVLDNITGTDFANISLNDFHCSDDDIPFKTTVTVGKYGFMYYDANKTRPAWVTYPCLSIWLAR